MDEPTHPERPQFTPPEPDNVVSPPTPTGLQGDAVTLKDKAIAAISQVFDPEIPVNIYELGLIYKCEINDKGDVEIDMTLTAPACPVAGILPGQVAEAAAAVEGVGEVTVEIVWDPPWDPSMMSEAARIELDMF